MPAAELTSEASEACAVDSLYVLSAGLPEAGPDSSRCRVGHRGERQRTRCNGYFSQDTRPRETDIH